jgi:hypothetical protein
LGASVLATPAITEGLIPALRDLGRVRESYEHATLRENLLAF